MLVLSRQREQVICIGSDVRITIVDIRRDNVRVGIEAPKEIPVHRQEIFQVIQEQERWDGLG